MADVYSPDEVLAEAMPKAPKAAPKVPQGEADGNLVVSLGDMMTEAKPEEPKPEGFFEESWAAIKALPKAAVAAPGDTSIGAVKAVAGGVLSLGELAVQGLNAIGSAGFGLVSDDYSFDKGLQAGQQMTERMREFSSKLTGINLAPANKEQEAFTNLLAIIPEGITAAGDTVFEKTGSAMAGAGTQALLTLLTLKPSMVSKTIGHMKGEQVTAGAKASKARLDAAFDELAAKSPEKAKAVAEHVKAEDPMLAKYIKDKVKKYSEASEADLVKIGEAQAKFTNPEAAFRKPGDAPKFTKAAELEPPDLKKAIKGLPKPPKPAPFPIPDTSTKLLGYDNVLYGDKQGIISSTLTFERASQGIRETVAHGYKDSRRFEPPPAVDARTGAINMPDPVVLVDEGKPMTLGEVTKAFEIDESLNATQPLPRGPKGQRGMIDFEAFRLRKEEGKQKGPYKGSIGGFQEWIKNPENVEGWVARKIEKEWKNSGIPREVREKGEAAVADWLAEQRRPKPYVFERDGKFDLRIQRGGEDVPIAQYGSREMAEAGVKKYSDPAVADQFFKDKRAKSAAAYRRFQEEYAKPLEPTGEIAGKPWTRVTEKGPPQQVGKMNEAWTPKEAAALEKIAGAKKLESDIKLKSGKYVSAATVREMISAALKSGALRPGRQMEIQAQFRYRDAISFQELNRALSRMPLSERRGPMGPKGQRGGLNLGEIADGNKILYGKLKEYSDQIIRTFSVESLGPKAKEAASIIAKNFAIQMQKESAQTHRSQKRRTYWNHRQDLAQKFINDFEAGKKFDDPVLQKAADAYRSWGVKIYEQDQKYLGKNQYDPLENYLYHTFEKSDDLLDYMTKKYGVKWGDPGFIKDRSFETYAEAIRNGFKPKFTNPEDIMLARQHASDIAQMRLDVMREMELAGLAVRIDKANAKKPPEWASTQRRAPNGDMYWVHNHAQAVLHNAFDTPSLWQMKGMGGDAFRGAMELKNRLVPLVLGLSLFHPLHVATIDNTTAAVRATKLFTTGKINAAQYAGRITQSYLYSEGSFIPMSSVFRNPMEGGRLRKVWQGKIDDAYLTASDRLGLQYMTDGGFVPEMSTQYRMTALENFKTAVAQRRMIKGAIEAPFALIDILQKPMFQVWIPNLKIASYLKDAKTAIEADPSLIHDSLKRQQVFRKLAKSVDNRYGEMAYNTLFWNRMVKDAGVASSLSLGWNLGFLREYGGAAIDMGQMVTQRKGIKAKGQEGAFDRPTFTLMQSAQTLMYGGLITYGMTGMMPEGWLDYTFPRIGGENPDGSPKRINTMFYTREFVMIQKHIEQDGVVNGVGHLVANKASPVIGAVSEFLTGLNSLNQEIVDPEAPAHKRMQQRLMNVVKAAEPMSLRSIREEGASPIMAFSGFSPAPKYITQSKTEGRIKSTFLKYYGQKQTPYERARYSEESKKLRQFYEEDKMDEFDAQLDKIVERFELTPNDQRRLMKNLQTGVEPSIRMFQRLSWQQQKAILDDMTEEERDKYLPYSNKEHIRNTYEAPN
jgi:hypothetical protein